jgi:hypothetical protein
MFEKFSRSWGLVKASATVLMQDKQLLVFPLISSIATILVGACFILPMLGLGALDGLSAGSVNTGVYIVGFLFYTTQYFIIFFFNAALVGAAMKRMDGGSPTVRDGLDIAMSRIGSIFGYALIAATVGMLLRAIQERVGFLGKIVVGLLGVGWTLATYLVVPVLVVRDVGPVDAVKESAGLLKKTWGENVIGQAGLGSAFALLTFGVLLCGIALVIAAVFTKIVALAVIAAIIAIVAMIALALIHAALSGIYAAALYRYASGGQATLGFDSAVLENAFAQKK